MKRLAPLDQSSPHRRRTDSILALVRDEAEKQHIHCISHLSIFCTGTVHVSVNNALAFHMIAFQGKL